MDDVIYAISGGLEWAPCTPERLKPMASPRIMLMSPVRLEREALRLVLEKVGLVVQACVDGIDELETLAASDRVGELLLVGGKGLHQNGLR